MLVSRDSFYNHLKNDKYIGLIHWNRPYGMDYDFNKDFESQTSYDTVYLNLEEINYFSDIFSENKVLDDLETLKNEMLEYNNHEHNRIDLCILVTKNDDDLFHSETEKKEFLWDYLANENDPEFDSFIFKDIFLLGKILYTLNDKDLVDFGLIAHKLYYDLTILRIQREIDDPKIPEKEKRDIYDVVDISSENFPLSAHQKEIFRKIKDLLDAMVEVDSEIINKPLIEKTLLNHLAKTIQPIKFIKKSAMFSQKQIDQINSIGYDGFSHNLRVIVDSYFNHHNKRISIGGNVNVGEYDIVNTTNDENLKNLYEYIKEEVFKLGNIYVDVKQGWFSFKIRGIDNRNIAAFAFRKDHMYITFPFKPNNDDVILNQWKLKNKESVHTIFITSNEKAYIRPTKGYPNPKKIVLEVTENDNKETHYKFKKEDGVEFPIDDILKFIEYGYDRLI